MNFHKRDENVELWTLRSGTGTLTLEILSILSRDLMSTTKEQHATILRQERNTYGGAPQLGSGQEIRTVLHLAWPSSLARSSGRAGMSMNLWGVNENVQMRRLWV